MTDREYSLLMIIINNNKCFDRRDNTFLLSNRKIAVKIGVSASKVDQLFRVLSKEDLVRKVNPFLSCDDVYRMLSPQYMFISYNKYDRWIIGALWELGSMSEVHRWHNLCKELNCRIDPCTGEVKAFNWWYIEQKAEQYTLYDRCYRKGSSQVLARELEDENNSQYYSLCDVDCHDLTTYDYLWFDSIVSYSELPYNRNMKFHTITPKNINTVKLEFDPQITIDIHNILKNFNFNN